MEHIIKRNGKFGIALSLSHSGNMVFAHFFTQLHDVFFLPHQFFDIHIHIPGNRLNAASENHLDLFHCLFQFFQSIFGILMFSFILFCHGFHDFPRQLPDPVNITENVLHTGTL